MIRLTHTLSSGVPITVVIPAPGAPPMLIIPAGGVREEDQDEVDLWLDTVVLPAMAEEVIDALTDIDP